MLGVIYVVAKCLFAHLSVCLSCTGILSKWLNPSSCSQHWIVALFSLPHIKIKSDHGGSGGVVNFFSFSTGILLSWK